MSNANPPARSLAKDNLVMCGVRKKITVVTFANCYCVIIAVITGAENVRGTL